MMIALGAAKGLAFLHNAEKPVIYRDFKTSNILLDSVEYISLFLSIHFQVLDNFDIFLVHYLNFSSFLHFRIIQPSYLILDLQKQGHKAMRRMFQHGLWAPMDMLLQNMS